MTTGYRAGVQVRQSSRAAPWAYSARDVLAAVAAEIADRPRELWAAVTVDGELAEHGRAVLRAAQLKYTRCSPSSGGRYWRGVAARRLGEVDSPVVYLPAGAVAGAPVVLAVGLKRKDDGR